MASVSESTSKTKNPEDSATSGTNSTVSGFELAETELRRLGYDFNDKGELRQLDKRTKEVTDKPFVFEVKPDDKDFNQQNYENLGEIITDYVYYLLERDAKMEKLDLENGSFVFVSPDWKTNKEKLLVLIHGSGVVRAGQWARRLIINNNLECGTQIPYIKRGIERGYAIVVFNTNDNSIDGIPIEGSDTPENHAVSAWEQVVKKSPAKHIGIVAHSFGGVVTVRLAKKFLHDFTTRVFSINLTDSVHQLKKGSDYAKYLSKVALNYVAWDEPLDTIFDVSPPSVVPMVSAGDSMHEWTSHSAIDSIFNRLDKMYPRSCAKI